MAIDKSQAQILKEFASFDEANSALFKMISSESSVGEISITQSKAGITAVSNLAQNIDKFGKALKFGTPCPVCGKNMKHIPPGGYCSIKCFMQDILKRVKNQKTKTNDIDKLLANVQNTLDMMNMALNLIAELPQKLLDIAKLPPEIRNYLQIRINIIFITLKIMINKLMIIKNNLLIKLLSPLQKGIIEDFIASAFPQVGVVMQTIQQLYTAFDMTYTQILKIITNPILTIPPESYVWGLTPRSFFSFPGFLYIEVPKSGLLTDLIPMAGGISVLQADKIAQTIQSMFPPILPIEYIMPPKAFDIRLALSNQSDIVIKTIHKLESFLKVGPEYMPRYKDLKLTNPFFIAACLLGWGPTARLMFGSFINPWA